MSGQITKDDVVEALALAGEELVSLMPEGLQASLRKIGFVDALVLMVANRLTPEPPVEVEATKVTLDGFKAS